VEEVFDFVADSRNEPSFNPAMTGVEVLTPPLIARGTRLRARVGRAGTPMLVELSEFDRPHRLGSRTTSSMMRTSGTLTFAAGGDGTVMSWDSHAISVRPSRPVSTETKHPDISGPSP
jgi:Polyketide cyclase / dehydrase and lipid transport